MSDPTPNAAPTPEASPALYATFPRRLNALTLDALLLLTFTALVFGAGAMLPESAFARGATFVVWVVIVVGYEPVLVSWRAATVGHAAMNLCVLDDRTGRRIGVTRAILRVLIKWFLGLLSFFSMNFSRRHRAIHDILTRSSVRIRDAAKARPYQYVQERPSKRGAA